MVALTLGLIATSLAAGAVAAPAAGSFDKRASCTFSGKTGAADALKGAAACDTVILNGIQVPAGVTLDLTKLKDGATVIFQGTTTFGYKEFDDKPLISMAGNKITVKGATGNMINADGVRWWDGQGDKGKLKPKLFAAHNMKDSSITDINIKNTPRQVMSINGCSHLTITNMFIDNRDGDKQDAAHLAHNTDGFDIGSSDNIIIDGATVYNQDDCVAINSGTQITFKNGLCSGGHGLSIGSVGGRSDNVVDTVNFLNSQVTKSTNGVRVKSFGTKTGKINKVTYDNITLSEISRFGVLIEQNYDGGDLHGKAGTGVPISGLTLNNIKGKGAVAAKGNNIVVTCGSAASCSGWKFSGVTVTGGSKYGQCTNVPSVTQCS